MGALQENVQIDSSLGMGFSTKNLVALNALHHKIIQTIQCSVATFCMYCYHYYSYFHGAAPAKLSPPRLIINQYEGDYLDESNVNTNSKERYYDSYEYIEYQYEYQFQQNYYRQRYGYYHDVNPDSGTVREEYHEYNDTMLYCWQLLLVLILFVICFTSFQVFGFMDETPTKHE